MNNPLAAIALLGATVFATPALAHDGWIEDFDKAVIVAKEQKKDLLVDFTGSDWCKYCIMLNKEVFDHDSFRAGVADNYILVSLDFPRSPDAKASVPNPERNQELAGKYGIQGYPTVLLMNADGLVYGQTGYQAGGPEAYLEHLAELRSTGRVELERLEAIVNTYEAAAEADKKTALGKILDALATLPGESPFASMLTTPAYDAFKLDPENESGLKLRAVLEISKSGTHTQELLDIAIAVDGTNVAGAYEAAVWAQFQAVRNPKQAKVAIVSLDALNAHKYIDKETAFLMNLTAADWSTRDAMKDLARSKAYAMRAKSIGHTDQRMMETVEKLAGDAN